MRGACDEATISNHEMSTDHHFNLEHRAHVRAQILALVKRFLSGQIGVIETARALHPFCDLPEPNLRPYLRTFVGIDSETDALPVGAVRKHWTPQALHQKDREIAAAERHWHEAARIAASNIARLLSSETSS